MVEVGECKHEELEFIGVQEFPGSEPLRLYNCTRCHTTVSRPGEFRTEGEITKLLKSIEQVKAYLARPWLGFRADMTFDTLESLINEVSRARTPEFWRSR